MITLEHVTKRYGSFKALEDVSLSIPQGQVLGLLGPNGAGKTTLLNILTGCLAPSSGEVKIEAYNLLLQPREAKRQIGYLPESAPLYPEMRVKAYLRFVCRLREVKENAIEAHILEIAELTGLTDVLSRPIGNLSKGYAQRVGLAQALCGYPGFLILDEPTSGLDPLQAAEFTEIVKTLAKEKTILFSSHLLNEVQSVCDRVVILHHGKIIADKNLRSSTEPRRICATIKGLPAKLLPALHTISAFEKIELKPGSVPEESTVILTCRQDTHPEEDLFTLLSGLHMPILRLAPLQDSLENIFFRVTENL